MEGRENFEGETNGRRRSGGQNKIGEEKKEETREVKRGQIGNFFQHFNNLLRFEMTKMG